jgi:hypothetical protein
MIETNLKKARNYLPHEVIRIINPKQMLLYIKNNVFPIDIYTSIDDKNNAILAMVFLKEDTTDVYKKWCNYELD